jgi:Regulator of chromosome condensation (RCC1) repeat
VVYENKEGLCCSTRRLIGSSRSRGPLGPPYGHWGANWYGQLGDGSGTDQWTPVRIGTETRWVSAVSGYEHTLALRRQAPRHSLPEYNLAH